MALQLAVCPGQVQAICARGIDPNLPLSGNFHVHLCEAGGKQRCSQQTQLFQAPSVYDSHTWGTWELQEDKLTLL